jgi:hypothetical protein
MPLTRRIVNCADSMSLTCRIKKLVELCVALYYCKKICKGTLKSLGTRGLGTCNWLILSNDCKCNELVFGMNMKKMMFIFLIVCEIVMIFQMKGVHAALVFHLYV